ncbi:MAG: HD domain-containing protein [Spirochaetales bacterium]|nr:MAG: HD domain-containing protein [Spirochaetales bacterium]
MITTYLSAIGLKDETRTGWELRGVVHPESVADHSWGTACLCLLYSGIAGVSSERSVAMALVHDLAEVQTGDVATRVVSMSDPAIGREKSRRETLAMERILGELPAGKRAELMSLWEEYEAATTEVALFVRDMNLVDMCAQALVYERDARYNGDMENPHFPDYHGMDEFFATTNPRLSTRVGKDVLADLIKRYNQLPGIAARGGVRLDHDPR